MKKRFVFLILLGMCFVCWAADEGDVGENPLAGQEDNLVEADGDVSTDAEVPTDTIEKKKFKALLLWTILLLITFMVIVFLTVLIRSGRRYRDMIGIGKKQKPTEHIDAWSNYRLSEEDMDIEPDEEDE